MQRFRKPGSWPRLTGKLGADGLRLRRRRPERGGRGYVAAARCCCTSGLARRLSRVRCRCARGLAVAFALRVKCRPFRFVVLGVVRKRARSDGLVKQRY
jgi:hypothetical protein